MGSLNSRRNSCSKRTSSCPTAGRSDGRPLDRSMTQENTTVTEVSVSEAILDHTHLGHPMDTQSITRTVPTTVGNLAVHVIGSGPPAVLWHSLFVDSTTWTPLRSHLVGQRRLISIDGPG